RRGPDAHRLEAAPGWVLGAARLAVIDLSERAAQPLTDGEGRWIVYNGEVYNFRELRAELEARGRRFRSDGDAEVVLQAFLEWGPACLGRLRGMFAFGLLDERRRELVLARDRYGVKPLAYDMRPGELRFASDLFALRELPDPSLGVDAESAFLYLAVGYVPSPRSIHPGVRKLRPGYWLRARWTADAVVDAVERPYWTIADAAADGTGPFAEGDGAAALDREYAALSAEAVRLRLVSDVPVATLLSGGIDSSLVTILARDAAGERLPAFTMGFDDAALDETPHARAVAGAADVEHVELRMGEGDVPDVWGRLASAYDEPFADASAVPTLALSAGVAERVKVALTGDGGDEVFSGYPWHAAFDRYDPQGADAPARLNELRREHGVPPGEALDRAAVWTILRTGLTDARARQLPVAGAATRPPLSEHVRERAAEIPAAGDALGWAARMDILTYLPDDLMVKTDRAGMHVGLELREPLLDHRLTTWCLGCPVGARYDRAAGVSKLLPRRLLERRLPASLLSRPKQGFTPPRARWLAGPLAAAADDARVRLERGGLEPLALPSGARTWAECEAGVGHGADELLWRVVCFAHWADRLRDDVRHRHRVDRTSAAGEVRHA
ncbi:MAG TPA: asparagine synthase (glutamine-hydrolyzing), partial [Gemmatimonadota bacterium]